MTVNEMCGRNWNNRSFNNNAIIVSFIVFVIDERFIRKYCTQRKKEIN